MKLHTATTTRSDNLDLLAINQEKATLLKWVADIKQESSNQMIDIFLPGHEHEETRTRGLLKQYIIRKSQRHFPIFIQ